MMATMKLLRQFQFSPLREGRLALVLFAHQVAHISILAPARGATKVLAADDGAMIFQFSPLREGRPARIRAFQFSVPISILAPARGATGNLVFLPAALEFQFSPLREGRQARLDGAQELNQFQFSPLREGRRCGRIKIGQRLYFNSRPCERGDSSSNP